jgi:cellulose 1,4-beta-cellobiosidase
VAVTGVSAGSVSLGWSPSSDDVGVTGYDVYRGGTLAGTVTGTAFTDTGLAASTAYTYTVKAHDAAGNVSAASAAVTATTAAGGGGTGSGCTATYAVSNDWGSGFTADVTVTNKGAAPTRGWTVTWTYGGNQHVTNAWNATVTQSGAAVTASNATWNGALAPAAQTHFGFQGTYSGGDPTPTLSCAAS